MNTFPKVKVIALKLTDSDKTDKNGYKTIALVDIKLVDCSTGVNLTMFRQSHLKMHEEKGEIILHAPILADRRPGAKVAYVIGPDDEPTNGQTKLHPNVENPFYKYVFQTVFEAYKVKYDKVAQRIRAAKEHKQAEPKSDSPTNGRVVDYAEYQATEQRKYLNGTHN